MRKIYSILAVMCGFSSILMAQNTITFQVDMNEYSGTYTTVNLNGTFNNWCGECAVMTDEDEDGVFSIEVAEIPSGPVEYKFTTDGWTEQETFPPGFGDCTLTTGQFTNRFFQATEDVVLDPVCWNACGACGDGPQISTVTFRVDMNDYTGPAFTTVNLNGIFNDWCGGCAEMLDEDGDDIYEIAIAIVQGTIEYKFTLDGWENEEIFQGGEPCTTTIDAFTNRTYTVTEDVVLDAVCWNACAACDNSIFETTAGHISIFPNPSSGLFTIDNTIGAAQLSVTDTQGRIVAQKTLNNTTQTQIDLTDLPVGVYQFSFVGATNLTQRVVISR